MENEATIRRIKNAATEAIRNLDRPGPRVIWFTLGRIGYLLEKIDERLLNEEYVSVIEHLLHKKPEGAKRRLRNLEETATVLLKESKESEVEN